MPEEWAPHVSQLMEDRDLGVVTSVMGLLLTLVVRDPPAYSRAVTLGESAAPVHVLSRSPSSVMETA